MLAEEKPLNLTVEPPAGVSWQHRRHVCPVPIHIALGPKDLVSGDEARIDSIP